MKACSASHSFLVPNNGQQASGLAIAASLTNSTELRWRKTRRGNKNIEITSGSVPTKGSEEKIVIVCAK